MTTFSRLPVRHLLLVRSTLWALCGIRGEQGTSEGELQVLAWPNRERAATRELQQELPSMPFSAAVSPDERWLAIGFEDGAVRVYPIDAGRPAWLR